MQKTFNAKAQRRKAGKEKRYGCPAANPHQTVTLRLEWKHVQSLRTFAPLRLGVEFPRHGAGLAESMQLKRCHRLGIDWRVMKNTQSSGTRPDHHTVAGTSEFKNTGNWPNWSAPGRSKSRGSRRGASSRSWKCRSGSRQFWASPRLKSSTADCAPHLPIPAVGTGVGIGYNELWPRKKVQAAALRGPIPPRRELKIPNFYQPPSASREVILLARSLARIGRACRSELTKSSPTRNSAPALTGRSSTTRPVAVSVATICAVSCT